jgi:hypothetical protein
VVPNSLRHVLTITRGGRLQENWDRIYEQFASGSFLLGRIVAAATNTFVTEQCAKDVCRIQHLFFMRQYKRTHAAGLSIAADGAAEAFVSVQNCRSLPWLRIRLDAARYGRMPVLRTAMNVTGASFAG